MLGVDWHRQLKGAFRRLMAQNGRDKFVYLRVAGAQPQVGGQGQLVKGLAGALVAGNHRARPASQLGQQLLHLRIGQNGLCLLYTSRCV